MRNIRRIDSRLPVLAIAAAGSLIVGGLPVAHASTLADDTPSIVVDYRDLDVSTQEGTLALYRRLVSAAKKVCPEENIRDLSMLVLSKACQTQAIERAVHTINSPQLAEIYAARSKHG